MKTPITDKEQWLSDQDCYGQTCMLVRADVAKELELKLNEANNLIERLHKELCYFDCDDTGQDLKEETRIYLLNLNKDK
jgi:hypothetical protein